MKKFDELEKIVKKHFPYAKWDEKGQAWIAVTRPNSKDQWEQPETLVAFDKEASKKFYSYMSSNSWDNEGNIQIGVRKNIFENYMKHIHKFDSFLNEAAKQKEFENVKDVHIIDESVVNEAEKKTFSKEEVIELLNKFRYKAHATGSSNPNLSVAALDKFIKDEL